MTNRTHSLDGQPQTINMPVAAQSHHTTLISVLLDFRLKYFLKYITSAAETGSKGVNYQAGVTANWLYWPGIAKLTSGPTSSRARNCSALGLTYTLNIERAAGWLGKPILQLTLTQWMDRQTATRMQKKMAPAMGGAETSCRKVRRCPS